MGELSLLGDLVVVFAVALVVVPLLRRIHVPTIAGFIVAGVLTGPNALGLIGDVHAVEFLADLGVALLLFSIGLDLSLERLRRLWRPIVLGGLLQVGMTIAVTIITARCLGLATRSAIFVGFLVAVSSTAIVLRGLQARGEVDAPHGRLTLGILVFQDLCVVPMMLVIPLLAGSGENTTDLLTTLLKTVGVLVGVLVAARLVVPRALHVIAQTRQRDLFILAVFVICMGTAWLVSLAGISLALGAFLAGLVVAASEYRHQALSDLIPFREVLTSLFFVSVGMLLDPGTLIEHIGSTGLLVLALLCGKGLIVVLVGTIMRLPLRVSILAGVALAQIGEFSFVLSRAAEGSGLLAAPFAEKLTAAAILTMLLTPIGLALGPHIAAGAGKVRWLTRLMGVESATEAAEKHQPWTDHVIIAGYGPAGRKLADALHERGTFPYVIVDLNPSNIREAISIGHPAVYGDVTSPEVLEVLNLEHARELAIVINDPDAVVRVVRSAKTLAPEVHILVRTRYLADVTLLELAGADTVVVEEASAAQEMSNRVLQRLPAPEEKSKEV